MDALLLAARGYPPPVVTAIEKMGNARYFIVDYHMKYFINDFVSPAIAAVVRQHGGQYIDMNAAISGLPAHTEFYVDYCHLTPAGNKLVAEQLAQSLQAFLADKK
jgi:lysophospholipase L1-like esterase